MDAPEKTSTRTEATADVTGVEATEAPSRHPQFVFREMLADDDAPVPSYDQLERFGLFDVSICSESLAQHRAKYPLPQEVDNDEDENVPPRPSPKHRHSIAVTPSSSLGPTATASPPLASPGLASSNKLSPFALAKRASRKQRPAQPRTRSTNDVLREAALPPLLSPDRDAAFASSSNTERRSSVISVASSAARTTLEEVPLAPRATLDRDSTIKEKRTDGGGGPRKLRKNPASRPPLPVIRTDDDFLLRPSSAFEPRSRSPSPSRSSSRQRSSSPGQSRTRNGWRASLSSLVSPVASPTSSFQMPHELPVPLPRQPRSPSPIDSFPSNVRRENSLPPVDSRNTRPRNDSMSDSYFGDSENLNYRPRASAAVSPGAFSSSTSTAHVPGPRDRTRTYSAQIPSPSSPVSTGNIWARALKFGRKGPPSRASSVASSSASATSWDFIDGASSEKGTFEVLRSSKVSPALSASRPRARRTTSEGGLSGEGSSTSSRVTGCDGDEGKILEASTSSPNLSKISEYPDSLDQRFHSHFDGTNPYRYLSTGSPPASTESFCEAVSTSSHPQGSMCTPPVTASSSKTILALDSTPNPATPSSTSVTARRRRSRSGLSARADAVEAIEPLDERDLPPRPSTAHSTGAPSSHRSRTESNASTTYRSTRSSSRDSIFSRRNRHDADAVAAPYDPDGGDETGATSVTEGEEDDDESAGQEDRSKPREAQVLGRTLIIDTAHAGVAL